VFQMTGPATAKLLIPSVVLVRGSDSDPANRRCRWPAVVIAKQSSAKCVGAKPCRATQRGRSLTCTIVVGVYTVVAGRVQRATRVGVGVQPSTMRHDTRRRRLAVRSAARRHQSSPRSAASPSNAPRHLATLHIVQPKDYCAPRPTVKGKE